MFAKRIAVTLVTLAALSPALAQRLEGPGADVPAAGNEIFDRLAPARRTPVYEEPDYWVWGSSVVRDDEGLYHLYVSRFPKTLPFHPGWMVASEIVHAVSEHLTGPYRFSEVALPARGAEYWDGRSTHNPRILRHDGKYFLIYMGSTHPFVDPTYDELTLESPWCLVARSNKRIGLAVSDTPYGPWQRFDEPLMTTRPGTFYSFLASNPSPVVEEDGSVTMLFKGRAHLRDGEYSSMALGIAHAPSIYGPYTVGNGGQPIFQVEGQGEAEDPFLWRDERGYHIVFKDHVAKYTGERGGGVLAHSADGTHWRVDDRPQAYSLTVRWDDGSSGRQGQLERPFIYFEQGVPRCIFFATMDGPGGFENATRSWNMAIPLR